MRSLKLDDKPDRLSRVWRRPKLPVLCAFCASPVWVRMTVRMKLCHGQGGSPGEICASHVLVNDIREQHHLQSGRRQSAELDTSAC